MYAKESDSGFRAVTCSVDIGVDIFVIDIDERDGVKGAVKP
jgi:hypothetical protein